MNVYNLQQHIKNVTDITDVIENDNILLWMIVLGGIRSKASIINTG
jgi:hypothetical protein